MRYLLVIFIGTVFFFSCGSGSKSASDRKAMKEESKQQRMEEVNELLASGSYVFMADNAMGQGTRMVTVTGDNYSLEIMGDSASSYLPFYGTSHMVVDMTGDGGIKFNSILEDIETSRNDKKKSFTLTAVARKNMISYNIMLEVFENGNAALNVNPSNRSAMSYNGEIMPIKEKE